MVAAYLGYKGKAQDTVKATSKDGIAAFLADFQAAGGIVKTE